MTFSEASVLGESKPPMERCTRRALLRAGGRLGLCLGGIFVGATAPSMLACGRDVPSCVDPELLSTAERALRGSRHYVDVSPHGGARQCGGCQFFRAEGEPGCGRCEILNGPVRRTGHCDAWAQATPAANSKGA